uniref:diacylglycerol O-acyltransferase n=1 Tax=Globodera rostochiensis TaxID=31243 RepID=A0A914HNH2_GLORO
MLTSGMVRELKASTSAWETFGCRAAKLASQLQQVATAFGSFVDGLQTISDSANSVNGVSRDIGAALTRFCLRQRSVELAIRKWGETLQKQCADDLGRRSGEWRQTVSDLERRHQRNCKRFKASGGGKHNNNKNRQQIEAESRNFYIELLHAQRAQCTEFVVGTLLPIINAQMVLLDEGAHIQPILDSLETSVNENDTAKLVQALLEDIDACSGANGHGMAPKRGENDDQLAWDQRIGIGMALGRAKSASQARLFGVSVGPERAMEEDDHSLNYGSTAMLTANRNSMPPPSVNSHQQLFSSCPSSAAATISSSSSSAFVVGSPASKGNNCGGAVGSGDGAAEDIWQQNISRNVPSSHQRMPLPQPFVHHQMAAERADIVSPTLAADTLPQNQCQKPPMPAVPATTTAATNIQYDDDICWTFIGHPILCTVNKNHSKCIYCCHSGIARQFDAQHADSTDSGSHCSSALIAETLQQIDRLGLELDNYCDGLDELNNDGGSERVGDGSHRLAAPFRPVVGNNRQQTAAMAFAETASSTAVRFRSSTAAHAQRFVVPPPPPPPPPLPPQRRNSAISSATPSAPSIAELRSIGASAPFGPSLHQLAALHPKGAVPPSPSPMPPHSPKNGGFVQFCCHSVTGSATRPPALYRPAEADFGHGLLPVHAVHAAHRHFAFVFCRAILFAYFMVKFRFFPQIRPFFWPVLLLYLCWFAWDFGAPSRGSHFCPFLHNLPVWRHLANYFPISVVKTAELPTDRNYLFSAHPHGIVGSSSFIFFATNGANFASIFPDLKMHSVTLDLNFWFPLRREMIMGSRMIPSNSKAIEWVLSRPGGGFAVGIVPGGAAEAMESFPGTNRLITARRKGFIKLAIKHGASIVPVFHFGETDVFHQSKSGEGSTLRKIQNSMKRLTRISFPLAYGQSFLAALLSEERARKLPRWLRVGFFPYRRKIVTVVGEPMEIEKNANCDEQTVDKIHSAYCESLRKLFDEHKKEQ